MGFSNSLLLKGLVGAGVFVGAGGAGIYYKKEEVRTIVSKYIKNWKKDNESVDSSDKVGGQSSGGLDEGSRDKVDNGSTTTTDKESEHVSLDSDKVTGGSGSQGTDSTDTADTQESKGDQQGASTTTGDTDSQGKGTGQDTGSTDQTTTGGTDSQASTGQGGSTGDQVTTDSQGTDSTGGATVTTTTGGTTTDTEGEQGTGGNGQDAAVSTPTATEDDLGFPISCGFKNATETKECELTKDQLEKVKFDAKDSGKVTIDGLNNGNKVKVTVESIGSGDATYTKGKKYTFKSETDSVTIKDLKDEKEVTLEKNKDVVFKENDQGKLEHVPEKKEDKLGIPTRCKSEEVKSNQSKSCDLTSEEIKKIEFETKGGASVGVEGLSGDSEKVTLTIEYESDSTSYPNNRKYKFKSSKDGVKITGLKDDDVSLEKNKDVVFKENGSSKLIFVRTVNTLGIPEDCKENTECKLGEEDIKKIKFKDFTEGKITVEGLGSGEKIKLKIETVSDTTNYPNKKKYTLSNSNGKDVKIKNNNQENGAITLTKTSGKETFKEESNKLVKVREIDGTLGLPKDCKEGSECDLTEEDIKKIKFDGFSDNQTTVTGLNGKSIKLKIEKVTDDTKTYTKGKKYTFSNKEGTEVIIKNSGKSDGDIKIEATTGTVTFKENNSGKLEKVVAVEDEFGIPLTCGAKDVNSSNKKKECTLTAEQLKKVKFKDLDGSTSVSVTGLSGNNSTITLKIEYSNESSKYPNNKKYTFDNTSTADVKIKGTGGSGGSKEVTLNKQTETYFKGNGGKLEKVEAKTKDVIAKEKKMKEVNDILDKAGLSGLKLEMSDFNNGGVSFKKKSTGLDEGALKKVQFKEFGGCPQAVVDLDTSKRVQVALDFTNDANKFPNNIKITFTNSNGKDVTLEYYISNGGGRKDVKIRNTKSGQASTEIFKIEDNKLARPS